MNQDWATVFVVDDRWVFARRTGWTRTENALSRARREAAPPRFDLTSSNPTTCGLPYDAEAIRAALSAPEVMTYAPDPLGHMTAREAVADYYARRGKVVDPSRVVLTASTSEAYAYAMRLLCDPGDALLVPRPSYPLFDFLVDLADVEARPYRLAYDGAWHLDRASVDAAIDARARAVSSVSPNNPTGTVLDAADREFLISRGLPVISDEVFADFAPGSEASWIGCGAPLLALNGLSKIAGLPQLKLGWMVVSGPERWVAEAMARLELIADTYLSVSAPVMIALPKLLALAEAWQEALRARLAENRAIVARALEGTALRARPSHGGWSVMLDVPRIESDEAWCVRLLVEDGVAVQPGYFYDVEGDGCLVVSLLVPPAELEEGLGRLVARIEGALAASPDSG